MRDGWRDLALVGYKRVEGVRKSCKDVREMQTVRFVYINPTCYVQFQKVHLE